MEYSVHIALSSINTTLFVLDGSHLTTYGARHHFSDAIKWYVDYLVCDV